MCIVVVDSMRVDLQLRLMETEPPNKYKFDVIISMWSYQCDHINVIISMWSYQHDDIILIISLWFYWYDCKDVIMSMRCITFQYEAMTALNKPSFRPCEQCTASGLCGLSPLVKWSTFPILRFCSHVFVPSCLLVQVSLYVRMVEGLNRAYQGSG